MIEQVFRHQNTARRQQALLDAIEADRVRRLRRNMDPYFAWCKRNGVCPQCCVTFDQFGDWKC